MRLTSNAQSESECQDREFLADLSQTIAPAIEESQVHELDGELNSEPDGESELQREINLGFGMCNSKLEEYAALISMFFGANLTQNAFEIVVDLLNSSYQKDPPKRFNSIADKFLKELDVKIRFIKVYFCSTCVTSLDKLAFPRQRHCLHCKTRLAWKINCREYYQRI